MQELRRLFAAYGNVAFGARHRAPCPAWRAERGLINRDSLPRFANRVFVFEEGAEAGSRAGYGRYLGFVSLRPWSGGHGLFPYTAVANLAPPKFMLRPRYHIITCPNGPQDGVMPARCVPFCTPNEDTRSRTSCFHAALHQLVLLKMVAFGCTPLSSQGVFTLLWELAERKRRQKIRRADEARSGRFHHVSPRLEEGLEVFQDPAVGAGGVLETFRKGDPDADLDLDPDPHLRDPKSAAQKEAVRCITDYLSNGLPVILQTRVLDGKGGRDDAGEPHAVLVFGMHLLSDPEDPYHGNGPTDEDGHPRVDIAELPGRLILHDIRTGPFTELPTREVMEQAWFKAKNEADAAIHFLTIAPKGTNFGVSYVRRQARALMRGEPLSDLEAYLGSVSCDAEGLVPRDENDMSYPHRWRYVTRLLQLHQLKARYFARVKGAQLSEQKEPCNAFEAKLKRARRQHRVEEGDYWWCVEVRPPYHPRPQGRRVPSPIPTPFCVYIWCTAQKAERNGFQPFASIRYAGRGKAVLNLNGKRNYRYAFFYNRA